MTERRKVWTRRREDRCAWFPRPRRPLVIAHFVLVAQLLFHAGVAVALAMQVDYSDLYRVEREIALIDKDLSGRVRVLESDMTEVKWLARGVAMAVIGQLIITGIGMRSRQVEHD